MVFTPGRKTSKETTPTVMLARGADSIVQYFNRPRILEYPLNITAIAAHIISDNRITSQFPMEITTNRMPSFSGLA